jgi:hypothetical protein
VCVCVCVCVFVRVCICVCEKYFVEGGGGVCTYIFSFHRIKTTQKKNADLLSLSFELLYFYNNNNMLNSFFDSARIIIHMLYVLYSMLKLSNLFLQLFLLALLHYWDVNSSNN